LTGNRPEPAEAWRGERSIVALLTLGLGAFVAWFVMAVAIFPGWDVLS